MAISTGTAIEFFGTQETLGTSSGAVSNGAFSVAGDLSTFTNTDDAISASVTLLANFSVAPTASTALNLFLRLLNVEGTNNNPVPDANFQHNYVGNFPLNDTSGAQYITLDINLPNSKTSQEYEFYIQNESGQTLIAGWDVYVTPKAIGPHA
jgi:hypothetical protein